MDDFQLRLIRALERLAGRDGGVVGGGGPVAAPVPTLVDRVGDLGGRLDEVAAVLGARLDGLTEVLQEIRDRLAAIHEDMPGGGPP